MFSGETIERKKTIHDHSYSLTLIQERERENIKMFRTTKKPKNQTREKQTNKSRKATNQPRRR